MKYVANPQHAKSVLVFACPVRQCAGGDFDLTAKLAEAVGGSSHFCRGGSFVLNMTSAHVVS